MLFAQVTRDKVIVEVGTGTWCQYCPGAAMGVDDLITNGWPVAAIENHNGDAFANNYSNARNSYYGISGYPTATFDGLNPYVGGSHTASMYSSYFPRVQARMNVPSPVTISIWGTHTGLTYNVTVRVEKVATIPATGVKLHLCITQSNIEYVWQGQTELNYVNRLMVPDQNGTTLDFSGGDVLEIPLTFNLQVDWPLPDLEMVSFVQNNSTKEIYNGYKVKLAFLMPPPPPLAADFSADNTTICAGDEVSYSDQSTGGATEWYWLFPGGTPDTSREENPVITYNEPGKYDVTLTVSNGIDDSTIVKPEYITVNPSPDVTFSSIDVQCVNYPPLELTQGVPEGGTYAGPGVVDNMFYPDQAGIGTHTLTYTYTNESGCEGVAEQDVVVDACTGIPENQGVSISTMPNPSNGSFIISLGGNEQSVNVRIVNSIGKTVFQKENIAVDGHYNTSIDLGDYSSGIYYVRVETPANTYYKKIIIQK
jgi:PKD repeat protein